MKVPVALTLVLALALPEAPATAGAPDIPEARRRFIAAVHATDRDVASLEAALEAAISRSAKLQAQDGKKDLEELKKLLGALKAFKTEKARILVKAEQAQPHGASAAEQAKEAHELGCQAQKFSDIIKQVVLVIIAVVGEVYTFGKVDPEGGALIVAVPSAIVSLTATLQVSLSDVLRALRFTGEGDTAARWLKDNPWFATNVGAVDLVTGFLTKVNLAMAVTRQANAAAKQAQARLQAAPKLPARPLPAVSTPTATAALTAGGA